MKRRASLLLTLAGLLIIFVSIGFSNRDEVFTIHSPVSYEKTVEHIVRPQLLTRWFSLSSTDTAGQQANFSGSTTVLSHGNETASFTITNPLAIDVKLTNDNKSASYLVTIAPDTVTANHSYASLHISAPRWQHWFGRDALNRSIRENWSRFDTYLNDSKLFYGFAIRKERVEDSAFLFTRATTDSLHRQTETTALFERLFAAARKAGAQYTGVRIFHAEKNDSGKIEIAGGIGIKNPVLLSKADAVQYKGMPHGKNFLVADYEGPYKDVSKVYEAVRRYVHDHSLTVMALPFEKILSQGYSFGDNDRVKLLVTYPVY